jgi:Amt family ammonium transporter
LAEGLLYGGGMTQFIRQLVGVSVVGAWCLATGFTLFFILKVIMGLRVSADEEIKGLDVDEHGMEAYPDFQLVPH